jgi:hypothetical protein
MKRVILCLLAAVPLYGLPPRFELPLTFEPNRGQSAPKVSFLSRGNGYALFLTGSEAVLALRGASSNAVVHMRLTGAAASARAQGLDPLAAKSNYFVGNSPRYWHTNIPNYGRVRFEAVYPGIDLVYYGARGRLEFDFLLAAGANPHLIRLEFAGA